MMGIVSILSKLFKTVGLLAVRLDLAELRWKKRKKISHFWPKSEFRIFDKNSNLFFTKKVQFNFKKLWYVLLNFYIKYKRHFLSLSFYFYFW